MSTPLVPPEQWRHLLRALLRECSYLPDPVAQGFMHDYVVQRFRRFSEEPESKLRNDFIRQNTLRKAATQKLSLLKRANEGYSRPLEKVLQLSYGRTGKRRRDLLDTIITPEVPADTMAVASIVKKPTVFEEGWNPPPIVVNLLKSQLGNGVLAQLSGRPLVRNLEPPIPKENSWGKPVSRNRQRNIRKKWYNSVLDSLLPPLPDAELNVLNGLLSGSTPWTPPKRRKAVDAPDPYPPRASLDTKFLTEGPQKGPTFRDFVNGRPHKITRRFMLRLWKRVSCLVPRMEWDTQTQKQYFKWDSAMPLPKLSATIEGDRASDLFQHLNSRGKVVKSVQSDKVFQDH